MAERQYSIEEIAQLAKALGLTQKNDPASTTLTAPTLHGPFHGNEAQFGLFSYPGVRPQRWSTVARTSSMARLLGIRPSRFWQELLEVMTGVTASSGTNATGWCGNPPTVGQGKVAQQIYKFGKYYVKTDLTAIPEVGQFRNRADVPAEILNAGPTDRNPFIPDLLYRMEAPQSQLGYDLWRIGIALERSMEKVLITGDNTQASNATEHGWIQEFTGLDAQIKTGYTDAVGGVAVPALDSAVLTFNTGVGGTIGGGDGRNMVQALSDLIWGLRDRAVSFGMDGVEFAIVMRKEAFRALVDVWACSYATYRCSTTTSGVSFNNDLVSMNQLRLEMMQGQYILVDGDPVPVVFSEGIPQTSQGNALFTSDIYVVPVQWQGTRLINMEYFPMDNPDLIEYASFADMDITTLNNGLFIVGSRSTALCKEYHFASKMRLILETPFLAGRVDDVQYTFRAPIRNADPSDTFNTANGGRSYNL